MKRRQEDQGLKDSVDYSENSSTVEVTRDFSQTPTNKQTKKGSKPAICELTTELYVTTKYVKTLHSAEHKSTSL